MIVRVIPRTLGEPSHVSSRIHLAAAGVSVASRLVPRPVAGVCPGEEGQELCAARRSARLRARCAEHAAWTENDVEELAKLLDRPGSPFHKNVRVLTCTRGEKNKA